MRKIFLIIPVGILAVIGYLKTRVGNIHIGLFDLFVFAFIFVVLWIIVSAIFHIVGVETNG